MSVLPRTCIVVVILEKITDGSLDAKIDNHAHVVGHVIHDHLLIPAFVANSNSFLPAWILAAKISLDPSDGSCTGAGRSVS